MGYYGHDIEQSLWIYQKILPYIRCKNHRCGNIHMLQCPFCQEALNSSHKSTAIRGYYYIERQNYWCYRCEKWATAFELYEKLSGRDRKELLSEYLSFVSGRRGVNLSNFMRSGTATPASSGGEGIWDDDGSVHIERQPIPDCMRRPLTERGAEYLKGRLVMESPNLPPYAKFYSASYSSSKYGNKPYEVVVIPWYLDGQVWGYQWRFLDKDVPFPKYGFPKNSGKKIYGIDSISTAFPFIICCEGVFDSLWVKNGVAVGGKAVTEYQRELLKERFPKHRIVYGFDNDGHGIKAMLKSAGTDKSALVFFWKDVCGGAKDLNDFALDGHKDYFFDEQNVREHIFNPMELQMRLSNPFTA